MPVPQDSPFDAASSAGGAAEPAAGSVLPEMRAMWWETGSRARAQTGAWAMFAVLPVLVARALAISWRADRLRTCIVAATTIGGGAMSTFGLLATQQVLIELFAAGPTPHRVAAALPALAVLTAATAASTLLTIATGYAENGLSPRIDREVERDLFEVTTAVRLDAFDADAFTDDMERASRGTDSVIGLVQNAMDLLAGVVGLLAVAVAVIVIHPVLLAALLVATLPQAWASLRAGRMRYQTYVASSVRRRRLHLLRDLMAHRDSATELRSYRLRPFLLDQYDRVMGAETRIQLTLARRVTTTISIGSIVGGLATAGVYVLLGILLLRGRIPLAAAATCVVALQAAQRSLTTVIFAVDRTYTEGEHFSDYTGFMQRAAAYLPTATPALERQPDRAPDALAVLSVDDATLRYPGRDAPALDQISLTLTAGQTVAFVGENGSGKSTLAALIAGLRTPDHGTVTWNGRPLTDYDPDALGARIAVVSQAFHQWPFSAATNIALGDTRAAPDRRRLEAAATRAVAHDLITALPYGYDTLLDRDFAGGQDLSGGEWQRITAARGFYRTADLLIMDEPSSALDPRAENALFQAIRDRRGVASTILITHRLANVRHADHIYVLHDGQLIETGTHDQLMATGGHYADLFTLQASGYRAPATTATAANDAPARSVDRSLPSSPAG